MAADESVPSHTVKGLTVLMCHEIVQPVAKIQKASWPVLGKVIKWLIDTFIHSFHNLNENPVIVIYMQSQVIAYVSITDMALPKTPLYEPHTIYNSVYCQNFFRVLNRGFKLFGWIQIVGFTIWWITNMNSEYHTPPAAGHHIAVSSSAVHYYNNLF